MKSLGFFPEKIKYRNKSKMVNVYVIEDLGESLLDDDTCEDIGIIKRIDVNMTSTKENKISFDPVKKFSKLFTGLERVKIPYQIRLRTNVTRSYGAKKSFHSIT